MIILFIFLCHILKRPSNYFYINYYFHSYIFHPNFIIDPRNYFIQICLVNLQYFIELAIVFPNAQYINIIPSLFLFPLYNFCQTFLLSIEDFVQLPDLWSRLSFSTAYLYQYLFYVPL